MCICHHVFLFFDVSAQSGSEGGSRERRGISFRRSADLEEVREFRTESTEFQDALQAAQPDFLGPDANGEEDWYEGKDGPVVPEVWQPIRDKSTGKVYFWNSQTGETSWEKPGKA